MNSKDLNNQLNQHPASSTLGRSKKEGQTHNYFSAVRHEISSGLQGQQVIQKTPSVFQTNPGVYPNYSKSQLQDEMISEMILMPQSQQPHVQIVCTTVSQHNKRKQSPPHHHQQQHHHGFCSLKNIPQSRQQQLEQNKQNQRISNNNHLDVAQVSCLTQINNEGEEGEECGNKCNNNKEEYFIETPSVQIKNNNADNDDELAEDQDDHEEEEKDQQNNHNNNNNMHFEDEQHFDKNDLEEADNERVQDYQEDSQYVQSQQICMEDLIDEEDIESSDNKKCNKNKQKPNSDKESSQGVISLNNHGDQMQILRKRNTLSMNQQQQQQQQIGQETNAINARKGDLLEESYQAEQVDLVLQQYNTELHLDQELRNIEVGTMKEDADVSCSLSETNNTNREGVSSSCPKIANHVLEFPHHDGVFSKQARQYQLDVQKQSFPSPSASDSCCQTPLSQNESKHTATDGFVLDDHRRQQTQLISPSLSAVSLNHHDPSPHFSLINNYNSHVVKSPYQEQSQQGVITRNVSTVPSTQAKTARTEITADMKLQNERARLVSSQQQYKQWIHIAEPESNTIGMIAVEKQLQGKDSISHKYDHSATNTMCKSATYTQKAQHRKSLQEPSFGQKDEESKFRNIPVPFDNCISQPASRKVEGDKDRYLAEDAECSEEKNQTSILHKQIESARKKEYCENYFCDSTTQIDGQSQQVPESLAFPSVLLKHHNNITPHDNFMRSHIQSFNKEKYLIDEEEPSPTESACQIYSSKQCSSHVNPLEEQFKEIDLNSPSSLNSINDHKNTIFNIGGKNKSKSHGKKTRQLANIEGDEIVNSKHALKCLKRHNSSTISQEYMNTSDNQFFQQSFLPLRGPPGNSQRTHPQPFNLTPSASNGFPQLEPLVCFGFAGGRKIESQSNFPSLPLAVAAAALHSPITVSSATSCLRPNHGICTSTESFRQNSHTQNVMVDKAQDRFPNFFNKETTDYTPSYLRRINSSIQRQLPNMQRNNSIYSQQLNDHCKLSNNNLKTEKYYLTSMGTHNFPTGVISQTLKDPNNENNTMTNFTVPYGFFFEKRYCQVCNIDQPLRSKHCIICRHCVSTYDHHCPWIGTCIAQRNRCHFFLFAFFHTFLSSYIILRLASFLLKAERSQQVEIVVASIGVVFIGYVFSMTFLLCIQHTYYILTNLTTWEYYSWEKITYLKDQPKHLGSPFSFGACKNIQSLYKSSFSQTVFDWEINKVRLPALANNLTIQP